MRTLTKKPSIPDTVAKYVNIVKGKPAPGDRIPIDTPMHISQRSYKQQNVFKYIAKVGGLDWNLFGYATAVRRKSDGALAVINGQHRMQLVKIVAPSITEVPAQIIEVDDTEFEVYASELFTQFNGEASKGLTNEELFYSKVLARDSDALYMRGILVQCGLSCGVVNQSDKTHPMVYANFQKCLKLGEKPTVRAVELMKKGFNRVADDPLHGLVFLLQHPEYSMLGDPNTRIGKEFELWLTKVVPVFHDLNDLKFKKYRANPSWQKGIAYGLLRSFAKYQRTHNKLAAPKITTIKKIYEAGFKKEDSGVLE